ncbi:hypothetical protein AWC06_16260 [Mycobacterium fragae]|uniref:Uncharacterized protein n=1 Tax=Mycobacterium fragae TaxID=1260918 RepID=A0A1X1US54_9MYCO|nr:hypothetical protein AWC06_16260 [Mycobacterium fragae]
MVPIGRPVPSISLIKNLVPAAFHAAAADRNRAESPVGQIIPIYLATQPQPGGALVPVPTADGGEPADTEPVDGGTGSGSL